MPKKLKLKKKKHEVLLGSFCFYLSTGTRISMSVCMGEGGGDAVLSPKWEVLLLNDK